MDLYKNIYTKFLVLIPRLQKIRFYNVCFKGEESYRGTRVKKAEKELSKNNIENQETN